MLASGLAAVALVVGSTSAPAGPDEAETRPDTDPRALLVELGWDQLHDLDYPAAIASFRALQGLDGSAPQGYLYEAVALWLAELDRRQDLDVNRYIDSTHFADEDQVEKDAELDRRFEALLARTEERIGERDDTEALYLRGVIAATRAGFLVTLHHDTGGALKAAREAVELHRQVVEREPRYWDAYLSLGLYEYVTGSLPFYIKWVAYLAGYRGNKEQGIKKLELTSRHGHRARRDARVILSVIYVREGRFEDALPLLVELKQDAPHNHILRLNEAFCLFRLERYLEAARAYREALESARRHARFDRAEVKRLATLSLLQGGEAGQALRTVRTIGEDEGGSPGSFRTLLLEGQILDAVGRREEALERYQKVSKNRVDRDTRNQARRYLKRPFVPATPPAPEPSPR